MLPCYLSLWFKKSTPALVVNSSHPEIDYINRLFWIKPVWFGYPDTVVICPETGLPQLLWLFLFVIVRVGTILWKGEYSQIGLPTSFQLLSFLLSGISLFLFYSYLFTFHHLLRHNANSITLSFAWLHPTLIVPYLLWVLVSLCISLNNYVLQINYGTVACWMTSSIVREDSLVE